MTFAPVGSWTVLLTLGVVLVILRLFALFRQRRRAWLRWAGLTLAVLLVWGAATRPGLDTGREVPITAASESSQLNVFLVVDRSVDSPVADMRADLAALIDEYPDARFALISFATGATMDWPLSDDVESLSSKVSGLSPYVASVPEPALQANAFAARDVLRTKAEAALQEYPGSRNLVFYLGTGDPESVVSTASFDMPPATVSGGAVLGYGETDEARLAAIADQLGVPYTTDGVLPQLEAADGAGETQQVGERREFYWLLALLAAALVLVEFGLTLREYHKFRLSRRDIRL
ncbi:hypothetical protein BH11ACT7_BH11ACT7_40890 [soil metagenome]